MWMGNQRNLKTDERSHHTYIIDNNLVVNGTIHTHPGKLDTFIGTIDLHYQQHYQKIMKMRCHFI